MIKKHIISGLTALCVLGAGLTVLACDCGSSANKTYEYTPNYDGTHFVTSYCHNDGCGEPYTELGNQECVPYEYYYDPFDDVSYYCCELCGAPLPTVYH